MKPSLPITAGDRMKGSHALTSVSISLAARGLKGMRAVNSPSRSTLRRTSGTASGFRSCRPISSMPLRKARPPTSSPSPAGAPPDGRSVPGLVLDIKDVAAGLADKELQDLASSEGCMLGKLRRVAKTPRPIVPVSGTKCQTSTLPRRTVHLQARASPFPDACSLNNGHHAPSV